MNSKLKRLNKYFDNKINTEKEAYEALKGQILITLSSNMDIKKKSVIYFLHLVEELTSHDVTDDQGVPVSELLINDFDEFKLNELLYSFIEYFEWCIKES